MKTKDPIERLREWAGVYQRGGQGLEALLPIIDEIEAQYMRVPVDMDGVPIWPGDMMVTPGGVVEVAAIGPDRMAFVSEDGVFLRGRLGNLVHAKHDTVEGLLDEFLAAYDEWDEHATEDRGERERIFADYAERIRAAVDGNGHQDHLWVSEEEYNALVDAAGGCQFWRDECKKLGEQLDRLWNDGRLA